MSTCATLKWRTLCGLHHNPYVVGGELCPKCLSTSTSTDATALQPRKEPKFFMNCSETTVSAIIPTLGRDSLTRAISSVRAQDTRATLEVVVVVDKAYEPSFHKKALEQADAVYFTGGRARGGAARNLGVQKATGSVVAYLDDDDEWLPRKTSTQLDMLEAGGEKTVASCRVEQAMGNGTTASSIPSQVITPGDSPLPYLFKKRTPSIGRAGIWTSSLMMSTDLARKVPWDEGLARHQDWDLLHRLHNDGGASIHQNTDVLTRIWVGSVASISASTDWESSLAWARTWRDHTDVRTYVDFLTGQTLRYAASARSWKGIKAVLAEIRSTGTRPSMGPTQIGLAGFAPRGLTMRTALTLHNRNTTITLPDTSHLAPPTGQPISTVKPAEGKWNTAKVTTDTAEIDISGTSLAPKIVAQSDVVQADIRDTEAPNPTDAPRAS